MIGSFLTRGLVMVLGYAYPAYECYKTVEKNKPEIEQLRFWCQYWILVAVLTVFERVGDAFISWLPMYSEAKLAFFIYLWYPKTRGTTYVYDSFFRPYVAKHENEIDRNLIELRTRASDMAVLYCQRAASYGQTRIFEILHYVTVQSTPKSQPQQKKQQQQQQQQQPSPPQQQGPKTSQAPNPPTHLLPKKPQQLSKEPSSSSMPSSSPRKPPQTTITKETPAPSQAKATPPPSPSTSAKADSSTSEKRIESAPSEAESMQIVAVPPESKNEGNVQPLPKPKETIMEETIRVTRGRLRKTRSAGTH